MKTPLTIAALAAVLAVATQAHAAPASFLLGTASWETFASDDASVASFAWAGENETFTDSSNLVGKPRQAVLIDEVPADTELLTGIPAPEPPALVLAGMAFGGVLCGRSLLMRRRKASDSEPTPEA